jgi:hypothetical protein
VGTRRQVRQEGQGAHATRLPRKGFLRVRRVQREASVGCARARAGRAKQLQKDRASRTRAPQPRCCFCCSCR